MRSPRLLPRILLASSSLVALAAAQTTELISLSSAGVQGNQFSETPAISGDGRYVVFSSVAGNLVAGDTNNHDDIFLRDRALDTTVRVSVATGGVEADGVSMAARISADGRVVVFQSSATNLAPNDTNATIDVFARDLQSGVTECVSRSSAGTLGNQPSYSPAVSANGRYVAFHSAATNLVTGDTNNAWDVFVRDRQLGTTTRVSVSNTGGQALSNSSMPALSADGRYVAFQSGATNLVTGDTNASWDIFVRDVQGSTTTRVSVSGAGVQGNGASASPSISGDGRFVAFHSAATNLVTGDVNALEDVFVRDLLGATTVRASVAWNGLDADGVSRYAVMSNDGRYVAFESQGSNLVSNDANSRWDVFVRDLSGASTERASIGSNDEEGDGDSRAPAISSSGAFVAFDSYASVFDPLDTNNNGDVFVRERGFAAPYSFCTAGTTTHGCLARMTYTGVPSASASSGFTVTAQGVEGMRQGILFYGLDNSGFTPLPWGPSSSFMCLKSPVQRTTAQNSGGSLNGCNGALSIDWNAYLAANPGALGSPRQAGQNVFVQAWFRDPPSPKTTMLSDALGFTVTP